MDTSDPTTRCEIFEALETRTQELYELVKSKGVMYPRPPDFIDTMGMLAEYKDRLETHLKTCKICRQSQN
jgi:hypothetical protein